MIHMKFLSPALVGQPVSVTVTQGKVSRNLSIDAFGKRQMDTATPPAPGTGGEIILPPPPPPVASTATVTITARRGQQQIAPEGIAFFAEVSGFDAQKPTDGKVYDPTMHDIAYTWTFGDPGEYLAPENILPDWRNKNVAYGPFPSHVFTKPGTYRVTCIANERSSGKTAAAFVDVTVQDPEAVFTAATTIVCSTSSNWTGAPAHDVANRTTTFEAAIARLRALKGSGQLCRVLFRAGEVFTKAGNTYFGSDVRNLYVSAYGTGRATIQAFTNGAVFQLWSSILVSGSSISRLAMVGAWDSTTETLGAQFAPAGAKRPDAFLFNTGFHTVHDCTATGMSRGAGTGPYDDLTAIISELRQTNWEDYGIYLDGEQAGVYDVPLGNYIGVLGCQLAQDPNALQGANGKSSTDLGNRHGTLRIQANGFVYVDVLDGFSRNGWTVAAGVPVDQNVIRDHRNDPRSRAFFSRISGEGGWSAYGSGPASPDGTGEGLFKPTNTVIDKAYFLGSARTVGHLGLSSGAFTGRNIILHRPNVGTGADQFTDSFSVGVNAPDLSKVDPSNVDEPVNIYNVTVVNELDNTQQARNNGAKTGYDFYVVKTGFNPGAVRIENIVRHRPNFTGGFTADGPLNNTRLGLVPRYLGYRWKSHAAHSLGDKLTMDTSFATPANPWSLWRPQAGSKAIGSAAGLVAHDDLLGNVRPAKASRGAVEPA